MTSSDRAPAQRYYDDNTRLLLTLGQGREGTIHRAVWGPGVTTRAQAMVYVDELVAEHAARMQAQRQAPLHVVDLGCGVGATLCRIAARTNICGTGVSISERQVAMAGERIAAVGLADRVRSVHGDFCHLPPGLAPAGLAYAIEAFVHARSARAFFEQCAALVERDGALILCDDFIADPRVASDPAAQRWLERFRRGWVVGSLLDFSQLETVAREHGFENEETIDLSRFQEMNRPRDYAIGALMRSFGWLPIADSYWSMLYGGHALQVAHKRGFLRYLFSVWRKVA
ncbi:MAG TPA: methyltransferase domain-containing protein [Polyangiaceae bacterium]|nr:methyltransferase domain-containing protein [Polyangiaceae bacterium]